MYAQNHDSDSASTSRYGSLGTGVQTSNGVSSGSQYATEGASRDLQGEFPNVFDPAPIVAPRQLTGVPLTGAQELLSPDHPPYGQGLQQEVTAAQ